MQKYTFRWYFVVNIVLINNYFDLTDFRIFAVCDNVQRQPVVPPLINSHSFLPFIGNYSLKNPVAFAFYKISFFFSIGLVFLGICFIFDF